MFVAFVLLGKATHIFSAKATLVLDLILMYPFLNNGIFHPMDAIKFEWSIIYNQGPPVRNSKFYYISANEGSIIIILLNSADSDEMPQNVASHLSIHCLLMYSFKGFQVKKDVTTDVHLLLS